MDGRMIRTEPKITMAGMGHPHSARTARVGFLQKFPSVQHLGFSWLFPPYPFLP
ncbi:hypothetical protein BDV37DRAFT_238609 [Aspergillus pseudonomiae]|uniref:Uncharacterized protein n=1 Tax=Aspergillus pseudonomiae TaxID=1506151 RepID=A0A5N7DQ30_9EURO|nr:uncharacterized protein BDV37DRAFT_238609 [Aspergillus pseudonomiae]KAE8408415.1 hypothetical protein BDV37DRAFT_238609 [Aspergillus pseudonomiae]